MKEGKEEVKGSFCWTIMSHLLTRKHQSLEANIFQWPEIRKIEKEKKPSRLFDLFSRRRWRRGLCFNLEARKLNIKIMTETRQMTRKLLIYFYIKNKRKQQAELGIWSETFAVMCLLLTVKEARWRGWRVEVCRSDLQGNNPSKSPIILSTQRLVLFSFLLFFYYIFKNLFRW